MPPLRPGAPALILEPSKYGLASPGGGTVSIEAASASPWWVIVAIVRPLDDGDDGDDAKKSQILCRLPKSGEQLRERYTLLPVAAADLKVIGEPGNLLDGSLFPRDGGFRHVHPVTPRVYREAQHLGGGGGVPLEESGYALRVDVTRHPFSFQGGEKPWSEEQDLTWKWKDDLNIYAGNEVASDLLVLGLPFGRIHALRTPGGLRDALNNLGGNAEVFTALERISEMRGHPVPLTVENLRERIKSILPQDLGTPRGKQVSELDVVAGDVYKDGLRALGRSVDIKFDFDVDFRWYPVDSQRLLLYSAPFGAQEAYADALARRHFTTGRASGDRATVVDAAEEVGLDRKAVENMLEGDEFVMEVWDSYRDTVGKHHIHSIPFFCFNGTDTNCGTFRADGPGSGEITVNGSGNVDQFLGFLKKI